MKKYLAFFLPIFLQTIINAPAYCQYKSDTLYTIIEREGIPPQTLKGFGAILSPGEEITSFLLKPPVNTKTHHNYYVMILRVEPNVKIISIYDVFNKYHISNQYQNLPIKIDGRIGNAKNVPLFSNTIIQSVTINKDNNGKSYISITTNHPSPPGSVL